MNNAQKLIAQFQQERYQLKAKEDLAAYIAAYIAEEFDRGAPKRAVDEFMIRDAIEAFMGGAR